MADLAQVDILLVEDNARDAEMTLRSLRKHNAGNQLHWVKDGAEALDFLFGGDYAGRAAARPPRLVMLDIKMPKVSGIEVLRRMKGDERTRSIPVVVMTSSNEEQDVSESYRLGVNSYVVKPVVFEALAETVARIGLYWLLVNRTPQ
jgi:two-component system response regulator